MRDMAANLGGLLMGCYICERKPPKLPAISLRRIRFSVLLVRFAQPAKLRLRKTQAFFSAQNDRLFFCLAIIVRFRAIRESQMCGRGELRSPASVHDMRSFSAGR